MNKENLDFLKSNLTNACLQSFGIREQFIALEFTSEKFDQIMFYVDCIITTSDSEVTELVLPLRSLHEEVFDIAYFIKCNLKHIIDCSFDSKGNFYVRFENEYIIQFDVNTHDYSNLAISFREKENDKIIKYGVDIYPNGVIEIG